MPWLESSLEVSAVSASMLKSWLCRLIVSVRVVCGNVIEDSRKLANADDCNVMHCTGNPDEFCGGPNLISVVCRPSLNGLCVGLQGSGRIGH